MLKKSDALNDEFSKQIEFHVEQTQKMEEKLKLLKKQVEDTENQSEDENTIHPVKVKEEHFGAM